jgi:hypothetical protein
MKATKLIVTFALLLICGATQAQFGKLIEKAAQKTIERKVEQPANTSANSKNVKTSAVSLGAATPEAIIAQCPALPTVKQLVNSNNTHAFGPEVEAFEAKVETLRENAKSIMESAEKAENAAGEQDGDRLARRYTGHSVAELENMSDEEQEAMINKKLASIGMGNMTLAQIQALDDKSDEEIMAAMSKSGVTIGGLTSAEIKAMESMTDAQKETYMKQGDRKQRAQAFANSQQTKEMLKQGDNAAIIMQTNTELQSINAHWRELKMQIVQEDQEAAKQIAAIDAKYAPKVFAIKPTIPLSGETGGFDFTPAAAKAREDLIVACRTEQYTLWRNHTIKVQERIKTVMANEVPRYDELMKQYLMAAGMTSSAPLTPSAGYSFAISYLDAAGSVTGLPGIEISGILGNEN